MLGYTKSIHKSDQAKEIAEVLTEALPYIKRFNNKTVSLNIMVMSCQTSY